MKRSIIRFSFCLACLVPSLFSCKKSDPPPPDIEKTLQNKNWRLTGLTLSPAYAGVTDLYNLMYEDCEKDNLYLFNAGNNFIYSEGPTLCYPGDPQTKPGTWSYNSNSKILTFQIGSGTTSDTYSLTITEINETNFTGTQIEDFSGTPTTETWRFQKQ